MNAPPKVGLQLIALGLLLATSTLAQADNPPPPAAFQALLQKHGVEEIDQLLDACSTFEKSKKKILTGEERRELLAVALDEALGDRDREILVMALWVSLRDSKTRAQEAIGLAPQLVKLRSQKVPVDTRGYANARHYSFFCEVYSLEDKETGADRERAWFDRIGKAKGDDRKALLTVVGLTKWSDAEQRIKYLREIYVSQKADEETRLTIAAVIFQGTMFNGLSLEECIIAYRDLARLPETTPAVSAKMFGYLAEYVYMAKVVNQINPTPAK